MRALFLSLLAAAAAFAQCPGFPNCLYSSGEEYTFTQATARFTYQDVMQRNRTLEVTARIPNRPGALPVVIWAHGGGEGLNINLSEGAMKVWSEITARRGYLSVAPAFWARESEDQLALCRYLGLPEGKTCDGFNTVQFDRPFDIRAIIDELTELNRSGPLRGRIDLGRIAVAGHSAGSSGTLSVAGAARSFDNKRYGPAFFSDPRPKAFVALSPSAPGSSSMFDTSANDGTHSWSAIQRPVLMATGLGDVHEQYSRGRRIAFDYMPPGDKYRLWVNDIDIGHGAFGDHLDDCDGIAQRKCEAFRAVLVSAVHAFLDAYLEQKPNAKTFLEEGYAAGPAPDILEWSRK